MQKKTENKPSCIDKNEIGINSSVKTNLEKRRIIILGKIQSISAINVLRALKQLNRESKKKPITVFVNGPGGDFFACLTIYQELCLSSAPIYTIAMHKVESGSFFITQAGKRRFGVNGTKFKFHRTNITYPKKTTVNTVALMGQIDQFMMIDAMQLIIFSERGRPQSKLFKLFKKESEIDTVHARKLNLVDGVIRAKRINTIQEHALSLASTLED